MVGCIVKGIKQVRCDYDMDMKFLENDCMKSIKFYYDDVDNKHMLKIEMTFYARLKFLITGVLEIPKHLLE